jgi:hypothetical protein
MPFQGIPFTLAVMLAQGVHLETLPTFSALIKKRAAPNTQERLFS